MRFYSRIEIVELLEIQSSFLEDLEREAIIEADAPAAEAGEFSEKMLERARVAYNLVNDLDVNLAGAAIIVRMREDMSGLTHRIEELLNHLQGLAPEPERR